MELNEKELEVLKACADNALDAAGGDFGFGDEIKNYVEMKDKQISGYLSQLSQKGLVSAVRHYKLYALVWKVYTIYSNIPDPYLIKVTEFRFYGSKS